MVIFLEVTSLTNEVSKYRIEEGLQIGRTDGNIIIDDPKASGRHAQIELDGKGQLILQDLGSSNGLLINGRRVKRIALLPGVSFEIGRTRCRVIELPETEAAAYLRVVTWRTILKEKLTDHGGANQSTAVREVQIFSPPVVLNFVQGIQTNDVITLGYGPRILGAQSLDLELLDQEAPATAFEVRPGPGAAVIKNLSSGAVSVNNKPVTTKSLNEGDIIAVGSTQIRITYV
jgi:pSer/pThr/pTyr-binding forkhead associated (FHA) protein